MSKQQKNVLGYDLEYCGLEPITGFYRDGCCNTGPGDVGTHTVCAVVTADFLNYSATKGNDLKIPRPEFGFPGLKNGDNWCVCAGWVARAIEAGKGCSVYLKKTHENTLKVVPIEKLKKLAIDLS